MVITEQIARNSQALINLAAKLEQLGYSGDDVHEVAERLALNLLADGYRRVEAPPSLRPSNVATPAQQAVRVAEIQQTLAARKTGQVS